MHPPSRSASASSNDLDLDIDVDFTNTTALTNTTAIEEDDLEEIVEMGDEKTASISEDALRECLQQLIDEEPTLRVSRYAAHLAHRAWGRSDAQQPAVAIADAPEPAEDQTSKRAPFTSTPSKTFSKPES